MSCLAEIYTAAIAGIVGKLTSSIKHLSSTVATHPPGLKTAGDSVLDDRLD